MAINSLLNFSYKSKTQNTMDKTKIRAHVGWDENNFCCGISEGIGGVVAVTGKTLERVKANFEESLRWHIEGCVADGDILPDYLVGGDYEIEYELDAAAMLRDAERFTTLAAISRASGINQKQLSHYANMQKQPRPAQRQRIVEGLHEIGRQFLAIQ